MSDFKPKILAEDVETFQEISDKLATLPESVRNQIETAELGLVGVDCKIRNNFTDEQTVYLPCTTQIKDFKTFIGIYAGDFFFRIDESLMKKELEYVFVDNLKK